MNKLINKYEAAIKNNETPKVDKRTTLGRYLKCFDKVVQYSDKYLLGVVYPTSSESFNETKYTLHSLETDQNWTILYYDKTPEFWGYGEKEKIYIKNDVNVLRGYGKFRKFKKIKENYSNNDIQEAITGFNSGKMM